MVAAQHLPRAAQLMAAFVLTSELAFAAASFSTARSRDRDEARGAIAPRGRF